MKNVKAWVVVAALAAGGCTASGTTPPLGTPVPRATTTAPDESAPPETTHPTAPDPTPPPRSDPVPDPGGEAPPPGRLVILDAAGDVAVVAPEADAEPVTLTDAFAEGAAYFQPLWAPGSDRIAFAEAGPAGFGLVTMRDDGRERAVAGMPSPPFYFYWAPDGSRIAALHNGLDGVELKIVEAGGTVGVFAGSGRPFYFSWSPDTAVLAAHIGSDRLTEVTAEGATSELAVTAAGYQSPHWTAEGIVHLGDEGLELVGPDDLSRTILEVRGAASFVLNPQGTKLAVQSFAEDAPAISVASQSIPAVRPNIVAVIDLTTGSVETAAPERSVGFFWSPDGEKLLMLHPSGDPGVVVASVWSEDGTKPVARFAPLTSFIRDVLPFFPQYAQSYQVWSPDSSHFAYAGRVGDEEGIWVQPIDGPPVRVAAGTWVAWSDG